MTDQKKRRASRDKLSAPKGGIEAPHKYSDGGRITRRTASHEVEKRILAQRAERRAAASPELIASLALGDQTDRERKRFGRRPRVPNLRTGELRRLFAERYGQGEPMTWTFPDDDAGRDDALLYAAIRLSAGVTPVAASRELLRFAPWLTDAEAAALAALAASDREQHQLSAKAIGRRLNLSDETRTRLNIRTIAPVDISEPERETKRKARDAEYQRQRRAMKRAAAVASKPQKVDPWVEQGISRRTYYRQKMALKTVGHISLDIYDRREEVPRNPKTERRRPEHTAGPVILH